MQVRRRRYDRTVLVSGQTLTGRDTYRVGDVIGEGGYSVVYSATASRALPVALKEFIPGTTVAERQELYDTYLHERDVLWGLRLDPYLPALIEAFTADGMHYLAQEFIPGESLQDRMNRAGPVPPSEVATLVLQVTRALSSLHSRGLVHHDVKPANVKFGDSGLAMLLDMGSARFATGIHGAPPKQSVLKNLAIGAIAGTPGYMAPELREMVDADAIASHYTLDIFALGCTIHHLVANRVLDQDRLDLRDAAITNEVVAEIEQQCPELAAPARRALSYRASDRYPSAQEMLLELQQVVPPRLAVRELIVDFDLSAGRGFLDNTIVITNAGGGTLTGSLSADHPGLTFIRPDGQRAPRLSFDGNACAVRVVVDVNALAREQEAHVLAASPSGEITVTFRFKRPSRRPISLSVAPPRAELTVTRQTLQQLTLRLTNEGGEAGKVLVQVSRPGLVHVTPAECQLLPGDRADIVVRPLREARSGIHPLTINFQTESGEAHTEAQLTLHVRASLWHDLTHGLFRRK